MKSSIQIHNELMELDNKIADAQIKFNAAEGDAKDAFRDSINQYKGEQKSLNDMLGDVLNEEDKIRNAGGVPLADPEGVKAKKPVNILDQLMGARDEFHGLQFGQTLTANVRNASDKPYVNMPGIEEVDINLPRQTGDGAFQFGFLDSLPTGTTAADVINYFTKDESKYKNGAAAWTAGTEKPSTAMGWKQVSAPVQTIAHLMPVLEQQVNDWGQLRSLIDVELLMGLKLAEAKTAIAGADPNGITGITKNTDIQTYTKAAKDDVVDAIRKMKTDVLIKSGFNPTHVAMHPYVAESLELMKDANGRYIQQVINGKLWALSVVEDINLTETTTTGSSGSKTTYGALVYWNAAATWFTKDTDSIQVGLIGNQFAYNEATIRAEGRHALKVTYPKAFSYLADTGITR